MLQGKIIRSFSTGEKEKTINIDDFIGNNWNDQTAPSAFAELLNTLYQKGVINTDEVKDIVEPFTGRDILIYVQNCECE